MEFDIDDIKPSALKRLLKAALIKEGKDKAKESADEDADKDREDLADLHEEGKGNSKAPKVKEDDLPEELRKVAKGDEDEDEDEDEDDDESPIKKSPMKKSKKKPPFEKNKKKSFPFQKKG